MVGPDTFPIVIRQSRYNYVGYCTPRPGSSSAARADRCSVGEGHDLYHYSYDRIEETCMGIGDRRTYHSSFMHYGLSVITE